MLTIHPRSALEFCIACLVAVTAGCGGSGDQVRDVSGKVTFAGKPVVYGVVEFIPDKAKDHSGPAGSAQIVDGEFNTRETGSGIHPGPHEVRITAYEERPPVASTDETIVTEAKPALFTGFIINATVDGGEQDFDVPESAKGFNLLAPKPAARQSSAP